MNPNLSPQVLEQEVVSPEAQPLQQTAVAYNSESSSWLMNSKHSKRRVMWVALSTILAILLILLISFIVSKIQNPKTSLQPTKFQTTEIPLSDSTSAKALDLGQVSKVDINGKMLIKGALIINPTQAPVSPQTGQIYLDKDTKNLYYYDGSANKQVSVSGDSVSSIGGVSGAITLGSTLSISSGVLQANSVANVTSIGGVSGPISLGSTLNLNNGVLQTTASVLALSSNDVSGVLNVTNGGSGTSTQFTEGSILFAGASGAYNQDNANLYWDSINKNLGLGTTSPTAKLSLASATDTAGGIAFGTDTNLFRSASNTLTTTGNFNVGSASPNIVAEFNPIYNKNTLDSIGDVGEFSSLALGADGFPRISYYDYDKADVKFIKCNDIDCISKYMATLDSSGSVGKYTNIKMGLDNFPRIVYYDATNTSLKIIRCLDGNCTTKNINTIDSVGDVGRYPHISIGIDGFARIAYFDDTNDNLKFVRCTNDDCTTNVINVVDHSGHPPVIDWPSYNAMELASDGNARIAYYDSINQDVKFAKCNNADCSIVNIATVDATNDVGRFINMGLGPDGLARISYADNTLGILKFARCLDDFCNNKNVVNVDPSGSMFNSIAVDVDGLAHMSGGVFRVNKYDCIDVDCTNITTTNIETQGGVGFEQSMAIGKDGSTFVIYYDNGYYDLKLVRIPPKKSFSENGNDAFVGGSLAVKNDIFTDGSLVVGSTAKFSGSIMIGSNVTNMDSALIEGWSKRTILNNVSSISEINVAMGADGFARLSYIDYDNYNLTFIRCTNNECSSNVSSSVAHTGIYGMYNSMALSSDGFARIAYYDADNADLKLVRCTNDDCSTSNTSTVDSIGDVGKYLNLAMGSDGFARIVYHDADNADLKFAQCTNTDCSNANISIVDSLGSVGVLANSVTVGSDGFARISYLDYTNYDLKFAQCTNADCSSKNITTIDSTGMIGFSSSTKMGTDGFPRIAYTDNTNYDLKFAQCTNADCSSKNITTIDSAAQVGSDVYLAIGSDTFARIAYYDNNNSSIKYAQCSNITCTTKNTSTVSNPGLLGGGDPIVIGSDNLTRLIYSDLNTNKLYLAINSSSLDEFNVLPGVASVYLNGSMGVKDSVYIDNSLVLGYSLDLKTGLMIAPEYVFSSNGINTLAKIDNSGQLSLPVSGPSGGISIGNDTNLYRNAADILRTPDTLIVDTNLGVGTAAPTYKVDVKGSGVIGTAVRTGTGLNDATSGGTYTGTDIAATTYTVTIDGTGAPNTFKWKKGAGVETTGIAITGAAQTITDGVTVRFAATTGHTLSDFWVITVTPTNPLAVQNAAGTRSFYVGNNGNVGIGTASPLGTLSVVSTNITGTTTSSALNLSANALTTGTGLYVASSTLTTGQLVNLQVSGTAADASQRALNILTTGANATVAITTYGAYISNTHTNATSGTNVAMYLNASGATTANYGLLVAAGNVGIGTTTPTAKLQVTTPNTAVTVTSHNGYFENLATNSTTDGINKYGLYVSSTGAFAGLAGTATNNYGLYVNTPTGGDNNYAAIFAAGNVGIGTTTPATALEVNGTIRNSGITSNTGTVVCINATNDFVKSATSACTNPSSIRLKENVTSMDDALGLLSQLRPVSFDWKAGSGLMAMNGSSYDYGLIAEEVNNVIPELVATENGQIQGLNYSGFVPFIVKAIQQQQNQIITTETSLTTLQGSKLNTNGGTIDGSLSITGSLNTTGPVTIDNNLTVAGDISTQNITVAGTTNIHILKVTGPADFGGDLNLAASVNTKQAITKKFIASGPIAAGSVVVLDIAEGGHIKTTTTEKDKRIIGVAINEALNAGDEVKVAIGGSVQVLVDQFTNVYNGDSIVSDSVAGKAKPDPNPGVSTVLGKATSPKDADNLIWVLITLQ